MQLKFISICLTATVIMKAVSASNNGAVGDSRAADFHDGTGRDTGDIQSGYLFVIGNGSPQMSDPFASKKAASAVRRRRAFVRRNEETDEEEEEDNGEDKDEGQASTEKDPVAEEEGFVFAAAETDASAENSTEGAVEKTSDDNESEKSTFERRANTLNSVPVVGPLLNNLLGGLLGNGKDKV